MVLAYSVKRSFIFHFYSSTCVFSTVDIKAHTEQYYSFGSISFHTDTLIYICTLENVLYHT